jgi:hypothetical protein
MDTAKAASLVTGIGFSIGLLYNYGYFWGLGPGFFALLTYKDHLMALVFFAAPCLVLALLFTSYRDRYPKLDIVMAVWIVSVIGIWSGMNALAGLPRFTRLVAWFIRGSSFIFISYLIAVILDHALSAKLTLENKIAKSVPLGMVLVVMLIMYGRYTYRVDIAEGAFDTQITLSSDSKAETAAQPARIVRTIDDGMFLILQSAPDRIVFVKKDVVKMIARKTEP